MAPNSPTVANWALGRRIREKREAEGLPGADGAKRVGITPAFLSEVEKGKKNLSPDKMEALLGAYEFTTEEQEELRDLRDQGSRRGWWTSYSALFSNELLRLFGLEHGAESLCTYDNGLVNGLLQTEDYARAIIESGTPNVRLAEADRRVQCRMMRQRRLTGEDPLRIRTIMTESSLRQQIGGRSTLRNQLDHLANLIEDHPDHVEVWIIPFEATGGDALGGSSFMLLDFPSGRLPTMLWQETVTSTRLTSHPLSVREYSIAISSAAEHSLSREDSLRLIKKASSEL
ncbi:helix-turn-helix transcriptional regulator [Saccharopolyspora sp. 6M]|uniref:helix-turn-helix domain-containing protein n=1 Tax=Saccharopolyspora sp. 6M TaxID=2877237 RepID=UPI001CD6C184|nr:helix-turn-helix transcriptional regulator [Saccharopolyspora sp. 6M]MCA1227000.1 helix-turn-helix transcriptional regulator [Saccharopolyspora sp. 6M]